MWPISDPIVLVALFKPHHNYISLVLGTFVARLSTDACSDEIGLYQSPIKIMCFLHYQQFVSTIYETGEHDYESPPNQVLKADISFALMLFMTELNHFLWFRLSSCKWSTLKFNFDPSTFLLYCINRFIYLNFFFISTWKNVPLGSIVEWFNSWILLAWHQCDMYLTRNHCLTHLQI